jgi:hypothetical protein
LDKSFVRTSPMGPSLAEATSSGENSKEGGSVHLWDPLVSSVWAFSPGRSGTSPGV